MCFTLTKAQTPVNDTLDPSRRFRTICVKPAALPVRTVLPIALAAKHQLPSGIEMQVCGPPSRVANRLCLRVSGVLRSDGEPSVVCRSCYDPDTASFTTVVDDRARLA